MSEESRKTEAVEKLVALVRFKLCGIFFLIFFCRFAAFFFVAGGICLTIFHAFGGRAPVLNLSVLGGAFFFPLVFSVIYALRKLPSERKIISLLDSRNPESGGILLAFEELGRDGKWEDLITMPDIPEFHLEFGRRFLVLAVAAAFLFCGVFAPKLIQETKSVHKMDISESVKKIEEDIELLKEEEILTGQEAEHWKDALRETASNATGEDPVKTWEAMDHIRQNIQEKVAMSSENAVANLQKLEALGKTAEMLDENSGKCDSGDFKGAVNELDEVLKKLLKDNPELQKMLDGASCKGGLSKENLKKLAEACKNKNCDLKKMLENLKKAGLCKNNCGGGLSEKELMSFLKENAPSGCKKISMCMKIPKPGEGSVDRGPGTAPLIQNDRDMNFEKKFKDEALNSEIPDMRQSQLLGMSAVAPETAAEGKAEGGHLKSGKISAGDDMRVSIQPRHQRAVREYFDHKKD